MAAANVTGKIIAFFEHKHVVCAVALEEKNDRVELLCQDGSRCCLSAGRVVYASADAVDISGPPEELLAELKARVEVQQELASRICVRQLWEKIGGKWQLAGLHRLAAEAFGISPDTDHEMAAMRALMRDRIYFKYQDAGFVARPPVQVEKLRAALERERLREDYITQAAAWLRAAAAGGSAAHKNRDDFIELFKDFVVFGKGASEYDLALKTLTRAGVSDPRECFGLLVRLGVWDEDHNLLPQRYGLSSAWGSDALQQVASLKPVVQQAVAASNRLDLTHLRSFAIDDPHTRDVDDAISFERSELGGTIGIHIADAASFVLPGTPLDEEAQRRGTSIYLPEGKIPMLPRELSEHLLSLRERCPRPAVSFLVKFDASGNVCDYQAVLSVVEVSGHMTYDEADADIQRGGALADPYRLMCRLREHRQASGATGLLIPESQVRVDAHKQVTIHIRDRESRSQVLVSEAMILANYCAAQLFREKAIPSLFRRQSRPIKTVVLQTPPTLFQLLQQRRCLSRVRVGLTAGPHSTLGLSSYVSVTSPLRKYYDLVTQRQLGALLQGTAPVYDKKSLSEVAAAGRPVLARAALVEQARKRYWLLKVLSRRVGEPLSALVLDARAKRYTLVLLDYLMDIQINHAGPAPASPGDIAQVAVRSVDPWSGRLKAAFVTN